MLFLKKCCAISILRATFYYCYSALILKLSTKYQETRVLEALMIDKLNKLSTIINQIPMCIKHIYPIASFHLFDSLPVESSITMIGVTPHSSNGPHLKAGRSERNMICAEKLAEFSVDPRQNVLLRLPVVVCCYGISDNMYANQCKNICIYHKEHKLIVTLQKGKQPHYFRTNI